MKHKTTEKVIKERYNTIISIGYCNLQRLLKALEPVAYTSGVTGWKADIYAIDGVAIVTGYRPFGNIKADYDICSKYENEAIKITQSVYDYEALKPALDNLISEFIEEVTRW